jgi:hypothetical protein
MVAIARSPIPASAAVAISGAALVCAVDVTAVGGIVAEAANSPPHLLHVWDPETLSFPQAEQNMKTSVDCIG